MCWLLTPDFPRLTKREGSSGSPLQMEVVGLQLSTAETGRYVWEVSCQKAQQEEEARLPGPFQSLSDNFKSELNPCLILSSQAKYFFWCLKRKICHFVYFFSSGEYIIWRWSLFCVRRSPSYSYCSISHLFLWPLSCSFSRVSAKLPAVPLLWWNWHL